MLYNLEMNIFKSLFIVENREENLIDLKKERNIIQLT